MTKEKEFAEFVKANYLSDPSEEPTLVKLQMHCEPDLAAEVIDLADSLGMSRSSTLVFLVKQALASLHQQWVLEKQEMVLTNLDGGN